jgi:ring-1,2-phenylacetyl-CoA epoxidase subunit PaaC
MQSALNHTIAMAAGIFEASPAYEDILVTEKVYPGESALYNRWLDRIYPVLVKASLNLPDMSSITPVYGGRQGFHTVHLAPLLKEMGEVFNLDTEARW